jgi:threonine dehydrogenase-like Zn-dependent dehydrogenase
MGQTHVQQYMPKLLTHILNGELHPEEIITHQLPLSEAARGYAMFDGKEDNCRKVVLTPGATMGTAAVPSAPYPISPD